MQVTGQSASPNNGFFLTTNSFTSLSSGSLLRIGHVASSGNTTAIIQNLGNGGQSIANISFPEGSFMLGTTTDNGYRLNNAGNTWSNGVRIGRDFSLSNRATVRLDSNGDNPADILFGRTPAALESGWDGVFWSLSSRGSGESNVFNIYRGAANTGGSEIVVLSCIPSGNVGIGTSTDVGARLHVNGAVRTGAPSGGSAVNWKLGTSRGGTVTTNATVRVEIDGVLVDLVARYV